MVHEINSGHCLDYFFKYIRYLEDKHKYSTRASTNKNVVIPTYKKVSGSRMFQTSAIRLWNPVEVSIRDTISHKQFMNKLEQKRLLENAKLQHFNIETTF